jgi:ketosteroid isomerase-like protein
MDPDPEPLGRRFVNAIASKDRAGLEGLFAPDLSFRGLTPSQPWEAGSPQDAAEIVLGSWFEPEDRVVETLEADDVVIGDRRRLRYRFRVDSAGIPCVVEQQGYYDVADGRITRISLVCSGFRELPEEPPVGP